MPLSKYLQLRPAGYICCNVMFLFVCKIKAWSTGLRAGLAPRTNGTAGSSQSTPVRVFHTVQAKVSSKSSNKIQINTYRRDCVVTVMLVSFQAFQRAG